MNRHIKVLLKQKNVYERSSYNENTKIRLNEISSKYFKQLMGEDVLEYFCVKD